MAGILLDSYKNYLEKVTRTCHNNVGELPKKELVNFAILLWPLDEKSVMHKSSHSLQEACVQGSKRKFQVFKDTKSRKLSRIGADIVPLQAEISHSQASMRS